MRSARVPAVLIAIAFAALISPSAGAQNSQPGTVAAGKLALTTNSPAAKEEFWQGLEEWQSGSYFSAQQHFRRAAALDNGFALARAFATGESRAPGDVIARDRAVADAARQSTEEGLLALFWREKALGHLARNRALLSAAMRLMPNEPAPFVEYLWSSLDEGIDSKVTLDSARVFRTRFPNYGPLAFPIPFHAMSIGDTAGAVRAAEEYTRIAPRTPVSFGYYGTLLQQLGRYDEAEVQYRKGMDLLPLHADYGWDAASALAEMYQWRGRNADARAVATAAVARASNARDSSMYMSELAVTYFAAGDTRRGTQLLEEARAKSASMGNGNGPDRPDAILAEANAVFGDGRSVSSYLARLHAETPVDSAVDIVIHALAYGYAGQLDSAMAYSDRLANNTTVPWRQPWAHRARGIALATAKQCDRAKTELTQADTSSLEVLAALAGCEMQLGHRAAALALRDRAIKSQESSFFRPAFIRARVRLAQMK